MADDPNIGLNVNRAKSDKFQLLLSDIPSSQLLFPKGGSESLFYRQELEDKNYFSLSLEGCDFPGITINEARIPPTFVSIAETDMTLTYDQFTTQLRMDADYKIYKLLVLWMYMIKNPEGYNQFNMAKTYEITNVDATLVLLNNMTGLGSMTIDLYGMRPLIIPTISLSYTNPEEIVFPVTWSYTYWMPRDANGDRLNFVLKDEFFKKPVK